MLRPNLIDICDGLVPDRLIREIIYAIDQPIFKFGQKPNLNDMFRFRISNSTGDNCAIERMYVNAYAFGACPTAHSDNDADGSYTALCYASEAWHYDWCGETISYSNARDEITRAIYPKPGRIAVFDGRLPHVVRAPTRGCPLVRYTIAIKLRKKPRSG